MTVASTDEHMRAMGHAYVIERMATREREPIERARLFARSSVLVQQALRLAPCKGAIHA